jgi:hypothetical protein
LDKNLHIAIQAKIFCEKLLLESIQQRWIQALNCFLVNYENTSKLIIDNASAFVGSNCDIAEFERTNFLIVLVEHVVKVLLDIVEVKEYAQIAALHLQNNFVDELINRILILVFIKVTAVEDLILS